MENRQILTIARLRAEAEDTYGQRLSDIAPSADRVSGGFARDDGATVRKVSCNRLCLLSFFATDAQFEPATNRTSLIAGL
jgi:hypothetical protein